MKKIYVLALSFAVLTAAFLISGCSKQEESSDTPADTPAETTEEGSAYTQCIEFVTDFHSPTKEEQLEGTAWEADKEYTDYQWWLGRTDSGAWELVSWGY